jgi:hypothetical protein
LLPTSFSVAGLFSYALAELSTSWQIPLVIPFQLLSPELTTELVAGQPPRILNVFSMENHVHIPRSFAGREGASALGSPARPESARSGPVRSGRRDWVHGSRTVSNVNGRFKNFVGKLRFLNLAKANFSALRLPLPFVFSTGAKVRGLS